MSRLIDRGRYYEIENYVPTVKRDEIGNVLYVINCPYIPKLLFEGELMKEDVVKSCSNGADE